MATEVIKNLFLTQYKDDYRDSDNYYQILFNSGRGLQNRELNQLQTIINRDMDAMQGGIYRAGASVSGGDIDVRKDVKFVKLDTSTNGLPATPTSIENENFTETTSGIIIKVLKVVAATGSDPATLFVQILDANSEVPTDTTAAVNLTPGRSLTGATSGTVLDIQTTNTLLNPAIGQSCVVEQAEGRFYVDGHAVYKSGEDIVVGKYDSTPTEMVGFKIAEKVITSSDDQNLFDNSGPNLNLAAPGADRYQVKLELTLYSLIDSDERFIPVAGISEGILSHTTSVDKKYSDIGEEMARRTHEESGNYTIGNFLLDFGTNDSDNTNLDITFNPGKAYVEGHRYYLRGAVSPFYSKPRTTGNVQNTSSVAQYGNYFNCSTGKGNMFNITNFEIVQLRSAITYGGSTIGTARVRAVEKAGSGYRVYLFEIKMNSGKNISLVRSLGDSTTEYFDVTLESTGIAQLKDLQNNNLLFALPRNRPEQVSDISITSQYRGAGTTTGTGTLVIPRSSTAFDLADASTWIVGIDSSGELFTPTVSSASVSSVTLEGLPTSSAATFLYYQKKRVATPKTKTLTDRTQSSLTLVNGYVKLNRADIYSLTSVTDDTTSLDITRNFTLDNGQKDNFYDRGAITLKGGKATPAGTVTVVYKFFDHGTTGDFFAVNSYDGQVAYEDIPGHRQSNGESIPLYDVLDFRPRKGNSGDNFTSTGAATFPLPRNTDIITLDVDYYLPKRGKAFIHRDGYVGVKFGVPAFEPKYPTLGDGTMEIASIELNPYMITDDDLTVTYKDNRRYTMRDIGHLEKKINDLEELTALTMLELKQDNVNVYDSAGNNRFKSGIFADNFFSDIGTDTLDSNYKSSRDVIRHEIRPNFRSYSVPLVYDSDTSTNTRLVGDNIYLKYTHFLTQSQTKASRAFIVNPVGIQVMAGTLQMSPRSDSWYDDVDKPDKLIQGKNKISVNGNKYQDWNASWRGITPDDADTYKRGQVLGSNSTTTGNAAGNTTETETWKFKSSETVVESLGEKVISTSEIKKMRARFISIRATGLRPNTKHFIFIGKTEVSDYASTATGTGAYVPEATLARNSIYRKAGKRWKNKTSYPAELGGATTHTTDANGALSGYILIPNNSSIKINTGRREILIIDVQSHNTKHATSYTKGVFTSAGVLRVSQEEFLVTREYDFAIATDTRYVPNKVYPPYSQPSCFTSDTLVTMSDGTEKHISAVRRGDMVKSMPDEQGYSWNNEVTAIEIVPIGKRLLYGINGINDMKPFVSEEHPLMTTEGWGAINVKEFEQHDPQAYANVVNDNGGPLVDINIGTTLVTEQGNLKIESWVPQEREPELQLYNLSLTGNNTYYANGILVHNKPCGNNNAISERECPSTAPSPAAPGAAPSGGDANGGDGTVICTALYNLGYLSEGVYRLDQEYGIATQRLDPDLYNGYYVWAQSFAEYIQGNGIGNKLVLHLLARPFAGAWAKQMAHELNPTEYKSNIFGKMIMTVGYPICRLIGKYLTAKTNVKI